MIKPSGALRYMIFVPGAGGTFNIDPFTDPDDFGNTIRRGVPQTPANITLWVLARGPAGDAGTVTIFPISIVFNPDGSTQDVVLQVTNNSPAPGDFLLMFLTINIPQLSNIQI